MSAALSIQNHKRIARNTLIMYIRMFLIMLVGFYTTRVVLQQLGQVDYGVYSVIGGIVVIFGFLNMSMLSATQRYLNYALGKEDEAWLRSIFSTAMKIHIAIALVIVVMSEAFGIWFLYHKMQIPPERIGATFWVLQASIFSSAIMVTAVPYSATLIAREQMSSYALISIIEVLLGLAAVLALPYLPYDKLITYALLALVTKIVVRLFYMIYCRARFPETRFRNIRDRKLLREMTAFALWSVFGNLSAVLSTQGLNMLLNLFFGPIVNTSYNIATQVKSGVYQLVSGFQTALNPQITKSYAKTDMPAMHGLMYRSGRFSYYLLFFIALPLMLETPYILGVWLGQVPKDAILFVRWMLATTLLYTMSNPLIIANQATGKVRLYQLVCGGLLLLTLPVSYLVLKGGFPAYSIFIVCFGIEIVTQFVRMIIMRPLIGIRIKDYFKHIYLRVVGVTVTAALVPYVLHAYMSDGFMRLVVVGSVSILTVGASSYLLGMEQGERHFVHKVLLQATKKAFNKRND